jgi:hypothetical protein
MDVVLTLGGTALFTIGFAAYVFAPIAGPSLAEPTKFHLSDIFSLVALWQYPLVLAQLLRRMNPLAASPPAGAYVLGGILFMVITALWLGLVTTLSRRGVHNSVKRFIVIAIATPLAIAATLILFPTVTGAVVTAIKPNREWDAWPAGVAAGCIAIGLLCRLITVWALKTGAVTARNERTKPIG